MPAPREGVGATRRPSLGTTTDFRALPGGPFPLQTARPVRPAVPVLISSVQPCAGYGCGVPREEFFMSFKSKVLAAAATLTLVGGVGAAGALSAGTASAATPSCGHSCIDIFSHQFGTHRTRRTTRLMCCGRARRSASRSSCSAPPTTTRPLDWTVAFQGTMADFHGGPGVRRGGAALRLRPGVNFPDCYGQTRRERPGVRDRVRALRRGQRPVHGRCRRTAIRRRRRHPAAVWRLRQDGLDRGHLRLRRPCSTAGTSR